MNYDVVIIGAGPAGISAAHNLINNNISCCVIDKQVFPRNKLCAGGLTNKTIELLKSLNIKESFQGENKITSKVASIHQNYKHIVDVECNETCLVDRFEFDDYLVSSYKNKGGIILESTKVKEINCSEGILKLEDSNVINYNYIIGADGAVGMTRKLVDNSVKSNGFCLQVDVDRDRIDYYKDDMSLYYGVLPYGYGWIFPKKDYLTIGFIGDYDKNIDYKKEFGIFLSKLGVLWDNEDYKGAFIPFGEYVKNPINKEKNLILVGDAAGLVDPISGEGIYFAIFSGLKASEAIINAISNNDRSLIGNYSDEIDKIIKSIENGKKLSKYVHKYQKPIFKVFKNKKIADTLFNRCIYDSNYRLNIFKN